MSEAPRLAGINVWSAAPGDAAALLENALGIGLRERDGHWSGRAGELMVSVHPSAEPHSELAFLVDAIEPAIESSTARGARVLSGPTAEPYGVSAHLEGPGDLRIELVQVHDRTQD